MIAFYYSLKHLVRDHYRRAYTFVYKYIGTDVGKN